MDRIERHPILEVEDKPKVRFYFKGKELLARQGEVITSALFANGIKIFGHHVKDGSPQGLFCANGQCAQCMVIADGIPVKGCMTQVKPGMHIVPCDELPELPPDDRPPEHFEEIETLGTDVLIIGGGPSGITASLELAAYGIDVIIVDDKHILGGKLVLQTHSFFGTVADCYAGTRGIDIAKKLSDEVSKFPNIRVMLNSTAVGCFEDRKIGIVSGEKYLLIKPKRLLVAAGARERALAFPGCDLPGVYGAGAFQTLVNRDLVKAAHRLFVVGGGNVGLIAAYHAIQAGINVVGLVEAMPQVGGYKVHQDKIKRLGVPVWTSHTIKRVDGTDRVESVTIAKVDKRFRPIDGTERTFEADTVLVAVGLNPISELYEQARSFGMKAYCAGDALEIAEASAAIFSGRIAGREIARSLGKACDIPGDWQVRLNILKSKPGKTTSLDVTIPPSKLFPIIRCIQEIPCDPCIHVCPKNMIEMKGDPVLGIPQVVKDECTGCTLCVAACPGLAITLVDLRNDDQAYVTVPLEVNDERVKVGGTVEAVDIDGNFVCKASIEDILERKVYDRTKLVKLRVRPDEAIRIAGLRLQESFDARRSEKTLGDDDYIVCRCERVTAGEIRQLIRSGVRDLNQLKVLRCGMGACGGKTCEPLILQLFQEEGINTEEVVRFTKRPLVAEVTLRVLAGEVSEQRGADKEGNK